MNNRLALIKPDAMQKGFKDDIILLPKLFVLLIQQQI